MIPAAWVAVRVQLLTQLLNMSVGVEQSFLSSSAATRFKIKVKAYRPPNPITSPGSRSFPFITMTKEMGVGAHSMKG